MTLKFKEQTALFMASNFLWIFLFRSTDHQTSCILDKSFESFSNAGLTLIPRALSVTRYTEKSRNKPAQCVTSRLVSTHKIQLRNLCQNIRRILHSKQNSLDNKMLVFVYRSVKYANRADVKLSVHRSFTFFCHLAHAFYLRAYVLFTLSFCS